MTNTKSGDRVKITNYFYRGTTEVESIEFADGTIWTTEDIRTITTEYHGTDNSETLIAFNNDHGKGNDDNRLYGYAGDDRLEGNNGTDELYGGDGNDTVLGGNGNDTLEGGSGNDELSGEDGDDILHGGTGNDLLHGNHGNDTYIFNLGDGQDEILEAGSGTADKLLFGEGISSEGLMFTKVGNDLRVSVIGQDETVTITNYYYNDASKIESFEMSDGRVLDYTKLDLMIQAMASFEDTTGMMWEEAIASNNEQANDIVNQWWTKDVV